MAGTQYLHEPIPGLTENEPDGTVVYVKRGTEQGYAQKVYGSPDAHVSWSKFHEGEHEVWHMGQAYGQLWDIFEDSIKDYEIGAGTIDSLLAAYPLVISSIPAPKICKSLRQSFRNQTIWVTDKMPSDVEIRDNLIVYNGRMEEHWYRASRIFGKDAIETTKPMADSGWMYGHKPIETDCDCHDSVRFHRVGRFGCWKKGVLSHHAFWDTVKILDKTVGRRSVAVL
jgi:hypothetical protein